MKSTSITKVFVVLILSLLLCAIFRMPARASRQIVGFYWDYDGMSAYKSLQNGSEALTEICPTIWTVPDASGRVIVSKRTHFLSQTEKSRIAVMPLITMGNEGIRPFHWILVSPTRQNALIKNILEALESEKRYQGVNLDFEGMKPGDRFYYNEFLTKLSKALHEKGYLLSIDVAAKSKDNPNSSWSGVFDYDLIGRVCDQVCVMTYDEHWSGGDPGPVSSIQYFAKCARYAESVMPKEKVLGGIPFYGYDWSTTGKVESLGCRNAMKLAERKEAKINWDEESETPWFAYKDRIGNRHTCWFENKQSLAAKLEKAHDLGIGGVCFWSMGYEDPAFWGVLQDYRNDKQNCTK